jgi:hypothetical protein
MVRLLAIGYVIIWRDTFSILSGDEACSMRHRLSCCKRVRFQLERLVETSGS